MSVHTATPHNDVRKQIISVAAEMFHQQGIRSVTMDDIATAFVCRSALFIKYLLIRSPYY